MWCPYSPPYLSLQATIQYFIHNLVVDSSSSMKEGSQVTMPMLQWLLKLTVHTNHSFKLISNPQHKNHCILLGQHDIVPSSSHQDISLTEVMRWKGFDKAATNTHDSA